jgi:hypothetical protein
MLEQNTAENAGQINYSGSIRNKLSQRQNICEINDQNMV